MKGCITMNVFNHHTQMITVLQEHFGTKDIVGIEIGTNRGDLTKAIMLYCPNVVKLYTVDPWKHTEGEQFEAGLSQGYHDKNEAQARSALEKYDGRVEIFKMGSDEAYWQHLRKKIVNFVWIDGHHAYEQVKKDINNYRHNVVGGGLIGGHDYGQVPDVTKAVDECYENVNKGVDFTWWVKL